VCVCVCVSNNEEIVVFEMSY